MRLPFVRRPPAWAVPGVPPLHVSHRGRGVSYQGTQLTALPVVAAALERAPKVFLALVDYPDRQDDALTREELCHLTGLGSGDGVEWELGLDDEVKGVVDTGPDLGEEDLIEQALAGQPDVVRVEHMDREIFIVTMAHPVRADEMYARYLDALSAAHRALAASLDIDLPE